MPKRREGPVRNKQTGYYFFDKYVGFKPEKKRIRVSLRTKDPARAQWLWEQEYKRQWGWFYGVKAPERPQEIRFSELIEEFIDYERDIKRIKEWRTFKNRLNIISEIWGDPKLLEISKDHFIQLDSHLKKPLPGHPKGRSEKTINHYFTLLKTLYFFAINKGYYKGENPIKEIKPYIVNERRREYTPEELSRILEAAEKVEREARKNAQLQKYAKRIVLLLLYTGMRLGEILNLKWDNIKDDEIVLKRTETKQRKEKVIPLTEGIKEILEDLRDHRRKNGYVLSLKRKPGQTKVSWADSVISKIREYSGVQDFIFHNIRHTASTIMVSEALGKGVGLADVMKILGHSQVETTMKYLHSDLGRMKKAVEILEEKTKKGEVSR